MEFNNDANQLLHSAIANQHALKSSINDAVSKVDQLSAEIDKKKHVNASTTEMDESTSLQNLQVEELKLLITTIQNQWSNLDNLISQAAQKSHDNEQYWKRWNLFIRVSSFKFQVCLLAE